jgi:hypothetical protein
LIGETVYQGKGTVTINRIIEGGDGLVPPKLEITLKGEGMSKDVPVTMIWTFIAIVNDDRSAIADGQGIMFSKDRDNREMVVMTAKGLGKDVKNQEYGRSQFVILFTAKNPRARGALNFLDKVVGMARLKTNEETMEYTIDIREWKLQ